MSNKSLLIVASLAYDGIETSVQKVDRTLGGAGSFICLSVKHFECDSSIVSVVGNDFHNEDLELLRSCGVDISGIEIIKDDKTFYWSCIYKNNFKIILFKIIPIVKYVVLIRVVTKQNSKFIKRKVCLVSPLSN